MQKKGGAILGGSILGAPAGVPKIEHQAGNAEGQSSPLQTVAVPEPARVMVRATEQQQSWQRFSAAMYMMKRSQARARLADKYWDMKQVAAKIKLEVPMQRQWAPSVEARGHNGSSAEEFRRQCSMWCLEEGKQGPCKMIGTCGDQARVMLWQGPAIVSVDRLARCVDFHAECDRHYTSKAGTVTPCKMLSSKSGRSEVMFANGKASVCSAQLSWRQAPAAAKRSEQQAREQQARTQVKVESSC